MLLRSDTSNHAEFLRRPSAWYEASISDFFETLPETILGRLQKNSEYSTLETQTAAWIDQILILREVLIGIEGQILLEYSIPRMGKRIDAVVIARGIVLAIEFKVGASSFDRSAIDQVWDYALDLKNFHEASHNVSIIPVLVATEVSSSPTPLIEPDHDQVYRPVRTNSKDLRTTILQCFEAVFGVHIDSEIWAQASYRPTPTIVEASTIVGVGR